MMKRVHRFIFRNSKDILLKGILLFKTFPSKKGILIFSEARGGSTWLMEMISSAINVSINWEPLHTAKGVVPTNLRLGSRPFIPIDDTNSDYISLFKEMHSMKANSKWTRKYLINKPITEFLKSEIVLTKYVRANLLVPFILKNEAFDFRPIFLIRHPMDTCISQEKAFKSELNKKFLVPNYINNDRFVKHADYINKLETALEKRIALWCINNCPTIEILDQLDVQVVYYSDLVLNPENVLRSILENFKLGKIEERLKKINFRQASKTDFNNQFKTDPEEQLLKNFKDLDLTSKQKIQHVFDYFNFKLFTANSPYPVKA